MPPMLKDHFPSSTSAVSTPPERSPQTAAQRAEAAARRHPVCLEMPVSVNGVRAVEGSEKREPFAENTRTVLVFADGAVLRLSAAVAPGQLLFVTNAQTQNEIVCQVVKSKNYKNVSGYVEVEFTEPSVGFWGMRFPGDTLGPESNGTEEETPSTCSGSRPETIHEAKSAPAAALAETPRSTPPIPSGNVLDGELSRDSDAQQFTSSLQKTTLVPTGSASPDGEPAAPAVNPRGQGTASGPSKPPVLSGVSADSATLSDLSKSKVVPKNETPLPGWLTSTARFEPGISKKPTAAAEHDKASDPVMENIGAEKESSVVRLFPGAKKDSTISAKARGGRGLFYGAIAAVVLLSLAASGWWYMQGSPNRSGLVASAKAAPPPATSEDAAPAPEPGAASTPGNFANGATQSAAGADAPSRSSAADAAPVPAAVSMQLPAAAEKIERSAAKRDSSAAVNAASTPAAAEQPTKKPVLQKPSLAAPIAVRRAAPSSAEAADINLSDLPAVPGGTNPTGITLAGESERRPSKPELAIGGDVKLVQILSRVPPVYPPLARKGSISGDVVIRVQVEADGSVSSMKVISGHALLRQAAMDSLRTWKYQPATLDGKPVAMQTTVTVQFRMK
ncbi:MAG TPA: TonB family protein [Candidatus Acidoferrales bacterium]|nr:TonB family protein [Candidatus Acidoferrales bacterium]